MSRTWVWLHLPCRLAKLGKQQSMGSRKNMDRAIFLPSLQLGPGGYLLLHPYLGDPSLVVEVVVVPFSKTEHHLATGPHLY